MYNHEDKSQFSVEDCKQAVGKRAALEMGGEIVDAGVSPSGPYVTFKPDENWGFGDQTFGLDLDALRKGPRQVTKRPSILNTVILVMLLIFAFTATEIYYGVFLGIVAGLYVSDWMEYLIERATYRKFYKDWDRKDWTHG